jgi:hypothetical protein
MLQLLAAQLSKRHKPHIENMCMRCCCALFVIPAMYCCVDCVCASTSCSVCVLSVHTVKLPQLQVLFAVKCRMLCHYCEVVHIRFITLIKVSNRARDPSTTATSAINYLLAMSSSMLSMLMSTTSYIAPSAGSDFPACLSDTPPPCDRNSLSSANTRSLCLFAVCIAHSV